MFDDEVNADAPAAHDPAVLSSVLVERSDGPVVYVWRLSGHDLQTHAFRVEGGYIEPRAALSVFENVTNKNAGIESYGPYEVWVAECGYMVPVAMALPPVEDRACVGCRAAVESSPLRSLPAAPSVRDWSEVEPLRRRRNAGARGKLPPVAELGL